LIFCVSDAELTRIDLSVFCICGAWWILHSHSFKGLPVKSNSLRDEKNPSGTHITSTPISTGPQNSFDAHRSHKLRNLGGSAKWKKDAVDSSFDYRPLSTTVGWFRSFRSNSSIICELFEAFHTSLDFALRRRRVSANAPATFKFF
jgi:hypothetical protein